MIQNVKNAWLRVVYFQEKYMIADMIKWEKLCVILSASLSTVSKEINIYFNEKCLCYKR